MQTYNCKGPKFAIFYHSLALSLIAQACTCTCIGWGYALVDPGLAMPSICNIKYILNLDPISCIGMHRYITWAHRLNSAVQSQLSTRQPQQVLPQINIKKFIVSFY